MLSNFTGSAATLNFTGSTLQWTPAVDGRSLSGTVTNAGVLTIATTTAPNNPVNLAGTLTNTGSIIVTGNQGINAIANGTTINNQAEATFDFQDAAYISSNFQTSTAFNNAGTLERTAGGGTASISFPVADTGKIESDSGVLNVSGGGSGPGIVNAGASGTVILGGTFSGALTGSAQARSSCRASPELVQRSTSPAALCSGQTPKMAETWPGPSPTRACC